MSLNVVLTKQIELNCQILKLGNKIFYRRNLPHYQPNNANFFVTFRLANSLPQHVIEQLKEEKEKKFSHFDNYLDEGNGNLWLSNPDIASLVGEAIIYRNKKDYELICYCIMPNHVHLIVTINENEGSLTKTLQKVKSFTAKEANKVLNREGKFWQNESYDRVIRDDNEFEKVVYYVINNPVKAGLCNDWRTWTWTYINPKISVV